ncbi:MAG TPA: hypothetical protein VGL58_09395 [Caulobacteraceae bacterium]|jgi:hypothetical protein
MHSYFVQHMVEEAERSWTGFLPIASLTVAGIVAFARRSFAQKRIAFSDYAREDIVEIYRGLRAQALTRTQNELGLQLNDPNIVYGVVMDWGYLGEIATLASFLSGDTSIYFSRGGGVLGGGAYDTVKEASAKFVAAAQVRLRWMTPTTTFPLPAIGRAKLYVLTLNGVFATDLRLTPIEPQCAELWGAGQQLFDMVMDTIAIDRHAIPTSLLEASITAR